MRWTMGVLAGLLLAGCGGDPAPSGDLAGSDAEAGDGGNADATLTSPADGGGSGEGSTGLPDSESPITDGSKDGSGSSDGGIDSGTDGSSDGGIDSGTDGSSDGGIDSGIDGSTDAGADGSMGTPDAGPDASDGGPAIADSGPYDGGPACVVNNGGCDPLTACATVAGQPTCGACPRGYSGTGAVGCAAISAYDYEWAQWPVPPEHPTAYVVGPSTVTDQVTGLKWQRGVSSNMSWSSAKTYCANLFLDGERGWRMPTIIELLSIVDLTVASPSIDAVAFPNTPVISFWSSTQDVNTAINVWYVYFQVGYSQTANKGSQIPVRCVR